MRQELATIGSQPPLSEAGALVLGTGLALTAMILIPALAGRLGLAESVSGALRIALMKASSKAMRARR